MRYKRAFCQTGRPSTIPDICWTKSKKKQQKGASITKTFNNKNKILPWCECVKE